MIMIICLAAMLLSCFCSLILKKQEMALLLTLFSFAFIFDYNKEMSIYFYLIPVLCGLLSVAANSKKNKIFWFLIFWFIGYFCLITVFNPYTKDIFGWVVRIHCLIFLFLWTMSIKWDRKSILFIVTIYGSYMLAWGFLEKLIYNPLRIGGPMAMATEYAIVLSILWGIWFVDSCNQKKSFLILIFPTILVLLAIIFSGTRTGLIGLFIGILLGIYSYAFSSLTALQTSKINKSVKFFIILILAFIILFAVWNIFMKDLIIARTMEAILAGKMDASNKGRIVAWLNAYDMFSRNRIWGVGPDTFSDYYSKFIKNLPDILASRKALPHAHNEILQVLSELGLLGLIHLSVVVSFCLFSIINYMHKNKNETICYGIIAGFSIFFVTMLVNGTPSFGFIPWIMGLMASFHFKAKNISLEESYVKKYS